MSRLTKKDEQGNWCVKGLEWEQLHVGQVITQNVWEKLYGALWKLMEYEDTGLTPEEIMDGKTLTGWISVAERLPEKTGDYWVAMRHLDGSVTTEKMFWRPDWPHEDAWNEVVVAWQPYYCPEPFVPQN